MSVRGMLRRMRAELSPGQRHPLPPAFTAPLAAARMLEIGGPSTCFERGGTAPVYHMAKSVDGVQPLAHTTWHDLDREAGYVVEGERKGELFITDDIDLRELPDGAYDVVISSHVIEHIANPLRALAAWRRLSVTGGHLLIVAPHMSGTFDHRRPLTTLEHMAEDLGRKTGEDDLTHLEEFLSNHDSDRNVRGVEDPDFVRELEENERTRLLHHHTFITSSLIELLTVAGLRVEAAAARLPHDIYLLGRWVHDDDTPDNRPVALQASRSSPFRTDRRAARQLASQD